MKMLHQVSTRVTIAIKSPLCLKYPWGSSTVYAEHRWRITPRFSREREFSREKIGLKLNRLGVELGPLKTKKYVKY